MELEAQPSALTAEQANFVYNMEVLGMPVKAAATMAGMTLNQVSNVAVMSARLKLRTEIQGRMSVTKEDVIHGVQEAIRDAGLLCDPMTQIKGYQVLNTMLGFDAPKVMQIEMNTTLDIVKKNIRQLPDSELVKLLGADTVIDGDFREIEKARSA